MKNHRTKTFLFVFGVSLLLSNLSFAGGKSGQRFDFDQAVRRIKIPEGKYNKTPTPDEMRTSLLGVKDYMLNLTTAADQREVGNVFFRDVRGVMKLDWSSVFLQSGADRDSLERSCRQFIADAAFKANRDAEAAIGRVKNAPHIAILTHQDPDLVQKTVARWGASVPKLFLVSQFHPLDISVLGKDSFFLYSEGGDFALPLSATVIELGGGYVDSCQLYTIISIVEHSKAVENLEIRINADLTHYLYYQLHRKPKGGFVEEIRGVPLTDGEEATENLETAINEMVRDMEELGYHLIDPDIQVDAEEPLEIFPRTFIFHKGKSAKNGPRIIKIEYLIPLQR